MNFPAQKPPIVPLLTQSKDPRTQRPYNQAPVHSDIMSYFPLTLHQPDYDIMTMSWSIKYDSTSPLHLLFSLPGMLSSEISLWPAPLLSSENAKILMRVFVTSLFKIIPPQNFLVLSAALVFFIMTITI